MKTRLNQFGTFLDSNGYAPSLFGGYPECFICKRTDGKIDRHEIYHGAFRTKSKALGCWCYLCHGHHMALHQEWSDLDRYLKEKCQPKAMDAFNWSTSDFIREFGKNYLTEEK